MKEAPPPAGVPSSEILDVLLEKSADGVLKLKDGLDKTRRAAALTSCRIFPSKDPKRIQFASLSLGDPDAFLRQEALPAVTRIGKPAADALPKLREMRATAETVVNQCPATIRNPGRPEKLVDAEQTRNS